MSSLRERFYIHEATPEGEALLKGNRLLQGAMDMYVASSAPHEISIPEVQLIGSGSYARVFNFNNEIALKISGPATIKEELRPQDELFPEDLREQFAVLSALRRHLLTKRGQIIAPEQFFVSRTPSNNFILAQELMSGWISLGYRMDEEYGPGPETVEVTEHINSWTREFRNRIRSSLGDFALRYRLTDLAGRDGRFHTGNFLVPFDAPLNGDIPLCIIDQPGEVAAK